MDADRWRRISLLYHAVRKRADEERHAFLDSACEGDAALRHEVESLLALDTRAEAFLAVPAAEAVANLVNPDTDTVHGVVEPGVTLGNYRIERLLGRGGMGTVFLAYDTTLHRQVALKVMDERADGETSRARLLREARNAAALNHPNICTIHEVGVANGLAFIAMEYVEGRSLRDRLDEGGLTRDVAFRYAIQAADALACAHDHSVIHRDFKAANVIVTETGGLKIVDFGLARRGDTMMASATTMASLVPAGVAAGTPYAMAPEQVRGEATDTRTDLWALGVLLYEMITGAKPFNAATIPELFSSILRDFPAPLPDAVPVEIRIVIERCLAKEPDRRYQHAAEVRQALEGIQTGADVPRPTSRSRPAPGRRSHAVDSVAVLPFVNAGNRQDTDYLCDGITESLINHLSEIPKLRVVPRSTAFLYKGVDIDPERAGRELNVRVLLTGRIRQRGDTLNVQAELVDAAANSQLWGQKYSRKLTDICAVEEQIAREIADTLRVKLNRAEKTRFARRATQDGEAYQLYLRGRYLWNRRTRDALGRAIVYFQQAIDRDPAYALAYAGLADCYAVLGSFTFEAPGEAFPRAKAAAQRAIEIDENLAGAHVTLAIVGAFFEVNRETAEREFRRALALNSNYAVAHQWYGAHLCFTADFKGGLAELDYARQLEPLSPMINAQLGLGLYLARRYEEAAQVLRNTLAFEPTFWPAHLFLAMVCEQQGDADRAPVEAELATQLSERHAVAVCGLGHVLGGAGAPLQAAQLLAELSARARTEYIDPYHFALVHLALGDETSALQRLQEAVSEHSWYASWLVVDPRLDRLRANAHLQLLLSETSGSDAVRPPRE